MVRFLLHVFAAVSLFGGGSSIIAQTEAVETAAPMPVVIAPGAILDLAAQPWLSRDAFLGALDGVLSGVTVERPLLSEAARARDPFLWSITGVFGAPLAGTSRPGGIVVCARYGLATRDRLSEVPLSDPEVFMLLGETLAAPDDAEAWPDGAVARVSCMLTWDDTRRVAIVSEEVATVAWRERFDSVTRQDDAMRTAAGWPEGVPFFGPRGYRVEGHRPGGGPTAVLESALIERRPAHQRLVVRSFLMNGGM